jgi:hypothetical protein
VDYQLQMDLEAVRFLLSLRSADAVQLLDWMDRVKAQPFSQGESVVRDDTGRDIQVSKCRRLLIYHWTDHPVKTVRIVKIERTRF